MSAPMLRETCIHSASKEGKAATESKVSTDGDVKLQRVTRFCLWITLLCVVGGTTSSPIIARTSRLNPPSSLTASAASPTQIGLTWSAPRRTRSVSSYSIWRCQGTSCQNFVAIGSVSASNTAYQDGGLSAATVYNYQVRSVSSQGASSSPSNTATATTLAASASPVVTSATTAGGTVGKSFSYQISATNSPTSYGASGLPGGLTINTASGLISGTPTNSGNFSVSLSATNGSGTGSATLALAVSSSAQITASPSSVAFGTVTEGTTNSQPITLTNNGGTTATFSQISVTGAGFAQTGLSTSTTIAPGGRTAFNATFDPSSTNTVSGSITLTTNGAPSPLAISLSGTGQATSLLLSASPTSLAFGSALDQSSSQLTTSVKNTGNSNVTISGVNVTGAGFSASGILNGTVLMPGQSVPLAVTFAPTSGGSVSGSVSIASNATNSPANVTLSGTGMHSVVLSWDASPTTGVTYNVFRATTSGGEGTAPINPAAITSLSYTDTSVTPGTSYYYTVEAVDSGGSSAASNEAAARVPSP